jgi:hypothetical protein
LIPELYRRLFPATSERLKARGLGAPALTALALDIGYDGLLTRIHTAVTDFVDVNHSIGS